MSMLNISTSWNVGRVAGRCAACSTDLPPNQTCWAALCDGLPARRALPKATPSPDSEEGGRRRAFPLHPRLDFCEACWAKGRRPENVAPRKSIGLDPAAKLTMFSYWRFPPFPSRSRRKNSSSMIRF